MLSHQEKTCSRNETDDTSSLFSFSREVISPTSMDLYLEPDFTSVIFLEWNHQDEGGDCFVALTGWDFVISSRHCDERITRTVRKSHTHGNKPRAADESGENEDSGVELSAIARQQQRAALKYRPG